MATDDSHSHIDIELVSHGYTVDEFSPCAYSVDLTIVDHRPTAAAAEGVWSVMIPCPNSCNSDHHYRSLIKDVGEDISTRCLNLQHCCAATLVSALLQVITAAHTCNHLHNVQLHVSPCTDDDPSMGAAALRESFEAEEPRTTPASHEAIEKLSAAECVGSDEDDDCGICLEDMRGGSRGICRMPCWHVFHRSCIVEWLKVSHVCPLCRYQMPVSSPILHH